MKVPILLITDDVFISKQLTAKVFELKTNTPCVLIIKDKILPIDLHGKFPLVLGRLIGSIVIHTGFSF